MACRAHLDVETGTPDAGSLRCDYVALGTRRPLDPQRMRLRSRADLAVRQEAR